jgi:hypothetical protein
MVPIIMVCLIAAVTFLCVSSLFPKAGRDK